MKSRQIDQYIWDPELSGAKMVFLSGPRQVGKTTFARVALKNFPQGNYCNWDSPEVRKNYAQDAFFFLKKLKAGNKALVIFDEIHKRNKWKDILKGIYDSIEKNIRLLITGSARLELFRKSGDSLVGRYAHFHLFPFSMTEILNKKINNLWLCNKADWRNAQASFFKKLHGVDLNPETREILNLMEKFSGFPEPFLKASDRFAFKWKEDYLSLILREDLRDISNIKNLDTVEKLVFLLPERIGSPLSVNALARDVETSFPTVRNHIGQLKKLWLLFSVKPWSQTLTRTVKKEEKVYFTNWTYAGNKAKQFENLIACSLFRACSIWTDLAWGKAELWYVRNFDQKEVDFLITLNNKPVLLVETKLSEEKIDTSALNFSHRLNVPIIQVLQRPSIFKMTGKKKCVVSAERFLQILP